MQGGFEAAGDLATGGVIGRAFEPRSGEAAHAHAGDHGSGRCLNCQAALQGPFCHECGQAEHIHKTLFSIFHDVLHGVYHFEGKIWRTLPLLFYKPGSLTRRYIAGERVNFVSPLALFLFSVFLMVATFETIGGPFGSFDDENSVVHVDSKQIPIDIAKNNAMLAELKANKAKLETQRKVAPDIDQDRIDNQIDKIDKRIDKVEADNDRLETARNVIEGKTGFVEGVKGDMAKNSVNINTGIPALDERIKKAVKSPDLFLYKLQSSAYKYSWMLVPISLPFIWLMFLWRRDVGPYDHAIFAIYSLSAMTIGVVGLSVLRAIGAPGGVIGTVLAFGPPLHMYKQLRGAYRIGRFSALWRTAFLLLSSLIAGTLFFLLVLSVAA